MIDPAIEKRARPWLEDPYYDAQTREEVKRLWDHPQQLTDAFFTDLGFGTGGLRGIMGVGTNRMNIYTIRRTTQGLAQYMIKAKNQSKGVVIGFDSRHHSEEFAHETAKVLAGNKIPVYLLRQLRPTPFISFSCRHLKAGAGVMITASHNPKEYNGYKVYWEDGAQVVPPHDTGIIQEVESITTPKEIKLANLDDPLITRVDPSIDQAYLGAVAALQFFPGEKPLKISYTSLHGTGITLMPQALNRWGFPDPLLVTPQTVIDGDFPTVRFPNPEYPEAMKAGIDHLIQNKTDLLIATDPDADRLGVVVWHQGKPFSFTGNEMATLAAYFICQTLTEQKKMPPRGALVTTIVTTEILKKIADAFSIPCFEVLTGFKYIGEKIHEWELDKNGYHFIFGAEESYGCLYGTYARDKDGIIAGCLFAEMTYKLKTSGKTLVDLLHEIYQKFGVFRERQFSQTFEDSKAGFDKIHSLMKKFRTNPPTIIAGKKVISIQDLLQKNNLDLPSADVLIFRLEDDSKIIIRPSGTEPKVKAYLSTHASKPTVEEGLDHCNRTLDELLQSIKQQMSN